LDSQHRRLMPRLDRLARSTRDLLNTLAAITSKDYDEKKPYQWFTLLICVARSAYFSKAAQNSAAVSNRRSSASRTGRGRISDHRQHFGNCLSLAIPAR
jgi:hypothetical protein